MPARQYVAVKFRIADTRTYTYVWDGEPLAEGDQVKVADNRSDGWKRVYVVSASDQAPAFDCKPILGKVEPEPATDIVAAAEQWSADIDPEELF